MAEPEWVCCDAVPAVPNVAQQAHYGCGCHMHVRKYLTKAE